MSGYIESLPKAVVGRHWYASHDQGLITGMCDDAGRPHLTAWGFVDRRELDLSQCFEVGLARRLLARAAPLTAAALSRLSDPK